MEEVAVATRSAVASKADRVARLLSFADGIHLVYTLQLASGVFLLPRRRNVLLAKYTQRSLARLSPTIARYDGFLDGNAEHNMMYATYGIIILRWLIFTDQPLMLKELVDFVAIVENRDPHPHKEELLEGPLDVLDISFGLINISTDADNNYSSMTKQNAMHVHYSVRDQVLLLNW
jgi:hypothetical protein